ncbi:MAG: family 43 glycosylhydrolase [Spirochaetales bacterium]|nr:family 43 glycosylhydrolase [Spirochaetales bacterium]MDY5914208.1 family 43 glycosylhydrolase [Treponema sp.]
MPFLLSYTRKEIDSVFYDARLAFSLHLAVSKDGKNFVALNHNSGVLFAKASENDDGSLNPKTLGFPIIVSKNDLQELGIVSFDDGKSVSYNEIDKSYAVAAILLGPDGQVFQEKNNEKDAVIFFTDDFVHYSESQKIRFEDYEKIKKNAFLQMEKLEPENFKYKVEHLEKVVSGIEGALPCNVIQISENKYEYLCKKLGERKNVEIRLPENIKVTSKKDLQMVRAEAVYSDGTVASKKIIWDFDRIDFSQKGKQKIYGEIYCPHFAFPIASDRADPDVFKWKGKYYFIATNDADQNHTLFMRQADSIEEIANASESLILDSSTYKNIGGLLWAPEFHEINGKLFIFFAATPGEFFWEESHVMCLKEGGNPMNRNDWSEPKRICRMDGSELCEAGKVITLDMTCFLWQDEYYVIWSQRQFVPVDLGAWLYIAKLDENEPWKLKSEPVLLSKPEFGWANNHTFVDEGPFALIRGDKLFVTFSSAAVDTSYVVGLLQIEKGKNPLERENWKKTGYPLLTSRSIEGEFGTGHNAYVIDEDGLVWNTYHARPGTQAPRSSGIRRVHFDVDGEPVLDLTEENDVLKEFRKVEIEVEIQ